MRLGSLLRFPNRAVPVVDTLLGQVHGFEYQVPGTQIKSQVFLGIPYAKSPVGELRFEVNKFFTTLTFSFCIVTVI